MTVGFTSCGDDDEPNGTVMYTMGFEEMSVTGTDLDFSDLSIIENAFKTALGVNNASFSINGKVNECDAKVKEACDKAVKALEGTAWKGYYVYVVTNVNTGSVVFTHTFSK